MHKYSLNCITFPHPLYSVFESTEIKNDDEIKN
jgi:hypothetical protein